MFNHDFFISHPKKKLPIAHAKKRNNFKMASQLKLKIHLLVHSGEKAFVCSQCDYSTKQADTLKVHMRVHSGEKPYTISLHAITEISLAAI